MQSLHRSDNKPAEKSDLALPSIKLEDELAKRSDSVLSLTQMADEPAEGNEPDLLSIKLEDDKESSPQIDPLAGILGRPSALLSGRCPICFGREKPALNHSRCVFICF
jgi:hypothetical protein